LSNLASVSSLPAVFAEGVMRRSLISVPLILLACGILLLPPGSARAEEKKEAGNKYRALVQIPEEKEEREITFDASNPSELHKLTDLLSKGEVEEMQKEKEVNILAISWDLGLWTAVVFILLLVVLHKMAWKPWLQGIHRREANIKEALAEAQRARTEGQQMRAELQKEMSGAQDKVRQLMEEARRDAQRAKDEMITDARKEIQGERERLQREIGLARDQALQELWTQTAQLATLVSAKAIRRHLNIEDHRRLVDEAIAELRTVGKDGSLS
jgi:F-type H+-transporting ATPase subunit b